jgi:four helix bundle protein
MTEFSNEKKHKYDLEERLAKFGEDIIKLCKEITQDAITRSLISQIIRSGTSMGANYCEANNASSKKRLSKQDIHL